MATRRRRSTPQPVPTPVEPTHEEMLEVAEEREVEAQREEEMSIEAVMSMALADTFEAIQKAEEEKGVEDFFDPDFYKQQVTRVPVVLEPPVAPPPVQKPIEVLFPERYIPRNNHRRRKS